MPDVYISRAGMESKELDEKFTQTEMGALKDSLVRMEQTDKIKDGRIKQLERVMEIIQKSFPTISRIVEANPPAQEIEASLRRRISRRS